LTPLDRLSPGTSLRTGYDEVINTYLASPWWSPLLPSQRPLRRRRRRPASTAADGAAEATGWGSTKF